MCRMPGCFPGGALWSARFFQNPHRRSQCRLQLSVRSSAPVSFPFRLDRNPALSTSLTPMPMNPSSSLAIPLESFHPPPCSYSRRICSNSLHLGSPPVHPAPPLGPEPEAETTGIWFSIRWGQSKYREMGQIRVSNHPGCVKRLAIGIVAALTCYCFPQNRAKGPCIRIKFFPLPPPFPPFPLFTLNRGRGTLGRPNSARKGAFPPPSFPFFLSRPHKRAAFCDIPNHRQQGRPTPQCEQRFWPVSSLSTKYKQGTAARQHLEIEILTLDRYCAVDWFADAREEGTPRLSDPADGALEKHHQGQGKFPMRYKPPKVDDETEVAQNETSASVRIEVDS